jgi:ribosomal-protein-alanine N-acetyltransferase
MSGARGATDAPRKNPMLLSNMPVIRRGESGDLPEIAALQSASPEAAHWNATDYLHYDLWVSLAGSRISGFLVSRAVAEGEYEILNLVVDPGYRRQGIARSLLLHFLEVAKGPVYLEVRESNQAARNLYKSLNFNELNIRRDYYDSPPEAAIVMKFHSC